MIGSVMRAVEDEFGEPFWDVVRSFAADGYGCDTTAGILGYQSPRQFRKLIKRHQIQIAWPAHGKCYVQQNREPHSPERVEKIRQSSLRRWERYRQQQENKQ